MGHEGFFVVVLTVEKGTGRLLSSLDIISRGFVYLRDSEELMGLVRQYLRQKAAQAFSGKYDLDAVKKEITEDVSHILYDQTRHADCNSVVNEVGGGSRVANSKKPSAPRKSPADKNIGDAKIAKAKIRTKTSSRRRRQRSKKSPPTTVLGFLIKLFSVKFGEFVGKNSEIGRKFSRRFL